VSMQQMVASPSKHIIQIDTNTITLAMNIIKRIVIFSAGLK
jgi:hypothetical protein